MRHIIPIILSILSLALTPGAPLYAAEATAHLTLTPTTASVIAGEEVSLAVIMNTGGQAVSGTDITIRYSNTLSFVRLDTANSVMTTEVPAPQNTDNQVTFTRLRFDTGYIGQNGHLAQLTFKALAEGTATVTIVNENSKIIPFSDENANILASAGAATITITKPTTALSSQASQGSTTTTTATTTTAADTASTSPTTDNSPGTVTNVAETQTTTGTTTPTTTSKPQTSNRPKVTQKQPVKSSATPAASTSALTPAPSIQTSEPSSLSTPETVSLEPIPAGEEQPKRPVWPLYLGLFIVGLLILLALPYALWQLIKTLHTRST